jgi:hypothetical protein
MNKSSPSNEVGAAMWRLVQRYTGRVGYKGGIKQEGLEASPPVIDCSGWVALLLSSGMRAANYSSGAELFSSSDVAAIHTWSDRLIQEVEIRTGFIMEGDKITFADLPHYATIGLKQGGGDWAKNHPRLRGITHIVQVVRHPEDGMPFVSEAQGWSQPLGVRLMPLVDWLEVTKAYLRVGGSWAVNPFA